MDVFDALLSARKNTDASTLNPEEKRLLDRMIRDRERNGLGLSVEHRAELLEVRVSLTSLHPSLPAYRHRILPDGFVISAQKP